MQRLCLPRLTDCLDDICTTARAHVADKRFDPQKLHNTVINRGVQTYTKCIYKRRTEASGHTDYIVRRLNCHWRPHIRLSAAVLLYCVLTSAMHFG